MVPWYESFTSGMPCFFAKSLARARSLAEMACTITCGWDRAGLIRARGLYLVNKMHDRG